MIMDTQAMTILIRKIDLDLGAMKMLLPRIAKFVVIIRGIRILGPHTQKTGVKYVDYFCNGKE
jgi:hypothetical protein